MIGDSAKNLGLGVLVVDVRVFGKFIKVSSTVSLIRTPLSRVRPRDCQVIMRTIVVLVPAS